MNKTKYILNSFRIHLLTILESLFLLKSNPFKIAEVLR